MCRALRTRGLPSSVWPSKYSAFKPVPLPIRGPTLMSKPIAWVWPFSSATVNLTVYVPDRA